MRGILTFIGGLVVGVLATTGICVLSDKDESKSMNCDEELELDGKEREEESDGGSVIVR